MAMVRCWKCGKEISDGTAVCPDCGTDQSRSLPVTAIGKGLRQLYDHYGAETVFTNSQLLVNGIGDTVDGMLPNELRKFKNFLRIAMESGAPALYREQITFGMADSSFDARVKAVLIDDACLNDKMAADLMGYFDEMIGWKGVKMAPTAKPSTENLSKQQIFDLARHTAVSGLQTALQYYAQIPGWNGSDRLAEICKKAVSDLSRDDEPKPPEPSVPAPNPSQPVQVRQSLRIGDVITFGSYGGETIAWQVLAVQNSRALLISKYALDAKPYNKTRSSVTWETCTLRKWLNGEFYNSAFSSFEKNQIQQVTRQNPDNPDHGTKGGNSTADRIFLLSIGEARTYFGSDTARQCETTAYAKANGAWIGSNNGNSYWWLRSPGFFSDSAAFVRSTGFVDAIGFDVNVSSSAVRPAFWLNL